MRKVYAALVLLAVLIGAGIAEYKIAVSAADDVLSITEQAQNALDSDDEGSARSLCRSAAELWNRRKPALQLFLPHGILEETDIAADRLVVFAESGDKSGTYAELCEFRDRLRAIKGDEEISVYNLF